MMIRRLLRGRDRGVSAIEFALVMPVVMLIMLGVADYGNALQQSLRLEAAARAGAQVAFTRPGDTGTTAFPAATDASVVPIRNAVLNNLQGWAAAPTCINGAGNGVCVTYNAWCQCPQGNNAISPTVGYPCDSDSPPCDATSMQFASITVTRNYSRLLLVPISTLRGNVEIRVR